MPRLFVEYRVVYHNRNAKFFREKILQQELKLGQWYSP
jgi:hypothetical protein